MCLSQRDWLIKKNIYTDDIITLLKVEVDLIVDKQKQFN